MIAKGSWPPKKDCVNPALPVVSVPLVKQWDVQVGRTLGAVLYSSARSATISTSTAQMEHACPTSTLIWSSANAWATSRPTCTMSLCPAKTNTVTTSTVTRVTCSTCGTSNGMNHEHRYIGSRGVATIATGCASRMKLLPRIRLRVGWRQKSPHHEQSPSNIARQPRITDSCSRLSF